MRFGCTWRRYDLFASVGETAGSGYALSRASSSAFGLGEYSEALRLGRAGYEAFSESNHRWGLITALCSIGFAALALGDGAEAHERFGEALERARASEAVSLELLALSGIGACLAEDSAQQERAAVLLTFATGHEQLPASYARAARPALERLEERTAAGATRRGPRRRSPGKPRRPRRAGARRRVGGNASSRRLVHGGSPLPRILREERSPARRFAVYQPSTRSSRTQLYTTTLNSSGCTSPRGRAGPSELSGTAGHRSGRLPKPRAQVRFLSGASSENRLR